MNVAVLCGGYGGAKMAHGFALETARRRTAGEEAINVAVIGNTADDLTLHGLHISPDLDTLMYTLSGWANDETGWGVRDETWSAAEMLDRYGEPTWFKLGDRDLATHIVRTARLREGERLTDVTRSLAQALGVTADILPMCDEPVGTRLRTPAGWIGFQDYFVRRHHEDEVLELRFDGIAQSRPTDEVLRAVERADLLVIAPSNPFVSVGPILAVPGMTEALIAARGQVVAVSPIVGGVALRGPAARLLLSLAGEQGAAGVARYYAGRHPELIDTFVIDTTDRASADEVAAAGYRPIVTNTMLASEADRRALAAELLGLAGPGRRR